VPGEPRVDRRIWVDGELVPWERASVHLLSHSLQRGSLIFDYMSVHATPGGAAIFRLREHVERFLRSAELVGLPLERKAAELEAAIAQTVRANPGATAAKICAYFPSIEVDVVPLDERVAVAIAAYDPGPDIVRHKPVQPVYHPELRLWLEKRVRNRRSDIIPPQAKVAANYVSVMTAKWRARREGYDEILLLDERGCVAEGPTTNVFLVDAAGALRTPRVEHVLPGVTRRSILEIAQHDGLAVHETDVRPEELFAAPEVFLTGTTAGVWPVASIDDRKVGAGKAGPVSVRLRDRFRAIVAGGDPAFAHWLTVVGAGQE
jgi:branched-chain amino acid aminotransferase